MNLVVIFDLDDTLFKEQDFVFSGFKAVSEYLDKYFNIPSHESLNILTNTFLSQGRKKIFNKLIKEYDLNPSIVNNLVKIYRSHYPDIKLTQKTEEILLSLKELKIPLYLVTDGHLRVQRKKIMALNLDRFFKQTLPTRQYGINAEKPSLKAFSVIKAKENIAWNNLFYIGDNPLKDFLPLNSVGGISCQILQGPYKDVKVKKEFEAQFKFNSLNNWFHWFKKLYLK